MAFSIFKKPNILDAGLNVKSKRNLVEKLSFPQGVMMWSILLAGYILFVVNWLVVGRLAGSAGSIGWINYFFGATPPPIVLTQAINYTITFMRGIGSFLVGYLIAKLTHKWAVVISLFFVVMALPALWMPNAGYAGFIIFRMLLAVGGTTLIVYIQPVMAKSMSSRQKGMFSIISPFGFNIGTIIAVAPFLVEPVRVWMVTNWQSGGTIFAALAFVPLILYLIFGKNFNTDSQIKLDANSDEKTLPAGTIQILKEKQTWVWVVVYGAWLTIAVIPIITIFADALSVLNPSVGGLSASAAQNIFSIVFVSGIFLAPFTIGRWNISNARRKPFVVFIGSMILVSFMFVIIGWAFGSIGTFFAFGFIAGWLTWSIQGVILNNPHERKGNTPKRIGTLFGFIWGFGYMFFTFANIILAVSVNPGSTSTSININTTITMLTLFFILAALFPIGFLFVKETKPGGPLIPNALKFWKKTTKNKIVVKEQKLK